MDHSCPKCGAPVDSGKPFCPQCAAPQIRVAVQPSPATLSAADPQTVAHVSAAALPTGRLSWSDAWRASLVGGLCSAFAFAIGLGVLGLGMLAGGIVSVSAYRRRRPDMHLSTGAGARLGALSGCFGFVLLTALAPLLAFVADRGQELRQFVLDLLKQATSSTDPQFVEAFKQFQTPEGQAILLVMFFFGLLVAFVTFSSLGGAIGAALARRKQP